MNKICQIFEKETIRGLNQRRRTHKQQNWLDKLIDKNGGLCMTNDLLWILCSLLNHNKSSINSIFVLKKDVQNSKTANAALNRLQIVLRN